MAIQLVRVLTVDNIYHLVEYIFCMLHTCRILRQNTNQFLIRFYESIFKIDFRIRKQENEKE